MGVLVALLVLGLCGVLLAAHDEENKERRRVGKEAEEIAGEGAAGAWLSRVA